MTERLFATLVPRTNASVSGCPYPTILNYIRDAAINVCERSQAYRYMIPTFDLTPGVHEYLYNVPDDTEVTGVFAAICNQRPLDLLNLDKAILQYPQWANLYSGESATTLWGDTPSGAFNADEYNGSEFNSSPDFVLPDAIVAEASSPRCFTQVSMDKYIVLPLPDGETYTMRIFVALKPTRDAQGMDSVAFNDLEDAILHRALQNLLVLPNVPWADRELAAYHGKQYSFSIAERRAKGNLGNMRGTLSVRNVPFA